LSDHGTGLIEVRSMYLLSLPVAESSAHPIRYPSIIGAALLPCAKGRSSASHRSGRQVGTQEGTTPLRQGAPISS
jgi:hypothetical protein